MNKNSLSKDMDMVIKLLEELKVKHGIESDPEKPPHHIDKAISELNGAKIDSLIDEVMRIKQRG